MKQLEFDFSYKGERNYVHGTDIYKKIMHSLNSIGYANWQYFELTIKKMCRHNLTCFLSGTQKKQADEVGNFKLLIDGKALYGSLIEDSDREIFSRYTYDEKDMANYFLIDSESKSIMYSNLQNEQALIDIIVSMSKFYLENAVDGSVKWFYRTTKFFRPIDDIKFRQISMKEILRKRSLVEFTICIDDEMVGYAYGLSFPDLA